MKPLIACVLVAAVAPIPQAQPQFHVRREKVQVAPGSAPQAFTVACPPGEQVLSGGFGAAAGLRVTGSHPADGREAWTVLVHNPTKLTHQLALAAVCGTVDTTAVSAPATSVRCPNGTVVTGGGFVSQWMPRQGGAAITGSYPVPGTGWGIDIAQLPAAPDVRAGHEVRTFVVCGRGLTPQGYPTENVEIPPGTPQCTGGSEIFAPVCSWPRTASAAVACDKTLVGGGFQVTAGRLPDYAVTTAMPAEREWLTAVDGRSNDNRPLAMRLTAVCVSLPSKASESPQVIVAVAEAEEDALIPIVVGVAAVVLALLLLMLVLATVARGRRRARQATAHVSVVLRAHSSAFRLDELREVR